MIEVEQKFRLDAEQEQKLVEGAVLDHEKINIDIYYDSEDLTLGKRDVWLRQRNGQWELKIGRRGYREGLATTYEELEDDTSIAEWFGFPGDNLTDEIRAAGYRPFVRIEKARRSYLRDGFRLDLDHCDFDYAVAEIELLIESADQQQEANDRIARFAASIGLDASPVRGKVVEYLHRYKPDHYRALQEAGVLDEV